MELRWSREGWGACMQTGFMEGVVGRTEKKRGTHRHIGKPNREACTPGTGTQDLGRIWGLVFTSVTNHINVHISLWKRVPRDRWSW